MRTNRTRDEQHAISTVSKTLEACGHRLATDETITDKPDWVFSLDGVRIGAECTCINLEKLMKWSNSNRNLKQGKCYKIVFPYEPHFWIRKAVEEKEGRIQSYIQNSQADELWLLLHSDLAVPVALYECNDEMLNLMSLAASAIKSAFDQIWFIHNESGAE